MSVRIRLILLIALGLTAISVVAQDITVEKPKAVLVDSFGRSTGEERSARFDSFFIQILNNKSSVGYVFVFCGKVCRYGEIEAHFRGIELKMATSTLPRNRIVVLHGGYRDDQEVELWLVPSNAKVPAPVSTRNIKDVKFTKAPKQLLVPYDCCDDIGSQWKGLKAEPNGQKGSNP